MRRAYWKSLQNGFEMDMETPLQGRMHSHSRGAGSSSGQGWVGEVTIAIFKGCGAGALRRSDRKILLGYDSVEPIFCHYAHKVFVMAP